jgi:GNAT superfamily N-acetyltransferase
MRAALAWDEDRAVGLMHHIRHRSCWTVGDYLYLQDLFVSPDVPGAGIGRKLIEHVRGSHGALRSRLTAQPKFLARTATHPLRSCRAPTIL